ncbi:hypothetical protein GGI19_000512 [Coemansia pectinata]|uniref:G-protein coupled receptors family 3 profile domain-containing protein n=1 Tax=Coemansia pectinata TaxID=1052879 RepID=A0A9W8H0R2_9FUNG|nr:hypothetical protein GGI19_000512 [Coemansia pectinata]
MGNHMSFSVTKSEEMRVFFASIGKQHLDPRQAADLIMVIIISIVYFIQLLAVIYMLCNRTYPPIKAKNPVLMTCVFISSIMWFTGDIQANGHAPLKGTPLQNCKAFGVWVRVLLGVCGIGALIVLRSYGLYRVFCRNLAYRGLGFYIPFIVASACMIIYGIVLQALPGSVTLEYKELVDLCYYNDKYKASLYALLWLTWVIIAGLNWCIRNIKSSFNETREMMIVCIIVFGVLSFMTAMSYTHARYPLNLTLRILATSLDQFAATAVWWLMMAVPLFKCLTNRQRYLKEWIYTLREDGLQQAYHIEPGTVHGNDTSGGNLSYLHPNPRKYGNHPVSTLVPTSSDKEFGNPSGADFFYGAKEETRHEKIAFPQMRSNALDGSDFDGTRHDSSSSSLVQHPQSSIGKCNGGNLSFASSPPQPMKRPWDKLTSAVNNFGVPSFTSNPVPPIPSSPLSPVSASAAAQPYAPILDYPEPAPSALLRLDAAQDSCINDDDKYGHNSRQLI